MNRYEYRQHLNEQANLREQSRQQAATTEPQTAAFQAAVDNIHFGQIWAASEIKSDWYMRYCKERDTRLDYIVGLEIQMERALRVNRLGYHLDS